MLEPDRDQLEIFVDAIFRHAKNGFVSLRAFYEGKDQVFRISTVPWRELEVPDRSCRGRRPPRGKLPETGRILSAAGDVPGQERRGRKGHRRGARASVECDDDPEAARAKLEPLLGPATVAVRSGGIWQSNGTG